MVIPFALGLVLAASPMQGEVTVYNQGFALVKENREISLREGRQAYALEDVAALIEPASVSIRSLADPNAFEVYEQNYQYDLISMYAILNKAVGKKITFVRWHGDDREVIHGTLMSAPQAMVATPDGGSQQVYNGMVIRTDDGRILLNPSGEIEVSSIPEGLISKPTLMWDLYSRRSGTVPIELSYLTKGMSWNADYVLTLGKDEKADLKGWVTMSNQSGANYEDVKLKLLAGDVQRVANLDGFDLTVDGRMTGFNLADDNGFQEESLFEYHLYTLQRPATIRNKETKQLSLLEGKGIRTMKKLVVDSMKNQWRFYPSEGEVGLGTIKPLVKLEFINSEENNLGMPLPMGNFKVYQRDKEGSVQMLGEDRIEHTPKNEKVSVVVGRSFDVVAERKRTDYKRIASNVFRETFEIEVRNRKEETETVHVLERHFWDWKILETSMPYEKVDSETQQYVLQLKPNEVKTIRYTVETRW